MVQLKRTCRTDWSATREDGVSGGGRSWLHEDGARYWRCCTESRKVRLDVLNRNGITSVGVSVPGRLNGPVADSAA